MSKPNDDKDQEAPLDPEPEPIPLDPVRHDSVLGGGAPAEVRDDKDEQEE